MLKQNLHTHSCYDDGKDTIEEMVQTAIEKGFTHLGFSGHSYNWPLDDCSMTLKGTQSYVRDIERMKKEMGDQIQLFCGIEEDSLSKIDLRPFDYVIGSVHYLPAKQGMVPVDYSRELFEKALREDFDQDIQKMVAQYYACVQEVCQREEVDIIGHVDLISKYNEDETYFSFTDPWYLDLARQAIDVGIAHDKIFEMNTGAMARGYRQTPYPHVSLLRHIAQNGGRICINTDCHDRNNLDLGLRECLTLAKEAGFKTLCLFDGQQFLDCPLETFQQPDSN